MVTLDESLANSIKQNWREAPLDAPERAMLGYVEKLTREPASVQPGDLDALRAAGFDDTAISQITMIASFFNYINRVADGLGVGRGP